MKKKYYCIVFEGGMSAQKLNLPFKPMLPHLFKILKGRYGSSYHHIEPSYYSIFELIEVCVTGHDMFMQFGLDGLSRGPLYFDTISVKDIIEVPEDNKLSNIELIELSMARSKLMGL